MNVTEFKASLGLGARVKAIGYNGMGVGFVDSVKTKDGHVVGCMVLFEGYKTATFYFVESLERAPQPDTTREPLPGIEDNLADFERHYHDARKWTPGLPLDSGEFVPASAINYAVTADVCSNQLATSPGAGPSIETSCGF